MTNTPPRFRAGTVIWGAVLLAVAAITFSASVVNLGEFRSEWIIWILVGLGAILVIAALVSLLVRAISTGSTRAAGSPREATAEKTEHQPVD